MTRDLIEVWGTGFHNRGAELMLHAVVREVKRWGLEVGAGLRTGSLEQLRAISVKLVQTPLEPDVPNRYGVAYSILAALPMIADRIGIASRSRVRLYLDASGFAYSDQWGATRALAGLQAAQRAMRAGAPVVLLPQAFGPFRDPEVRRIASELFRCASLIFARDEESYCHVLDLGFGSKLRLCPDFTVSVPPANTVLKAPGQVCITPNVRMLQQETDATYSEYLAACVRLLDEARLEPFFLLHTAREDRGIAQDIARRSGLDVPVIGCPDALETKALVGQCYAMVGSRYHGLINAFSQAVPAIGTSWSHKYEALFREWDCEECLVRIPDSANVENDLSPILDGTRRDALARRLVVARARIDACVREMWDEIRTLIQGGASSAS